MLAGRKVTGDSEEPLLGTNLRKTRPRSWHFLAIFFLASIIIFAFHNNGKYDTGESGVAEVANGKDGQVIISNMIDDYFLHHVLKRFKKKRKCKTGCKSWESKLTTAQTEFETRCKEVIGQQCPKLILMTVASSKTEPVLFRFKKCTAPSPADAPADSTAEPCCETNCGWLYKVDGAKDVMAEYVAAKSIAAIQEQFEDLKKMKLAKVEVCRKSVSDLTTRPSTSTPSGRRNLLSEDADAFENDEEMIGADWGDRVSNWMGFGSTCSFMILLDAGADFEKANPELLTTLYNKKRDTLIKSQIATTIIGLVVGIRDVKPGNFFLDKTKGVARIDFGWMFGRTPYGSDPDVLAMRQIILDFLMQNKLFFPAEQENPSKKDFEQYLDQTTATKLATYDKDVSTNKKKHDKCVKATSTTSAVFEETTFTGKTPETREEVVQGSFLPLLKKVLTLVAADGFAAVKCTIRKVISEVKTEYDSNPMYKGKFPEFVDAITAWIERLRRQFSEHNVPAIPAPNLHWDRALCGLFPRFAATKDYFSTLKLKGKDRNWNHFSTPTGHQLRHQFLNRLQSNQLAMWKWTPDWPLNDGWGTRKTKAVELCWNEWKRNRRSDITLQCQDVASGAQGNICGVHEVLKIANRDVPCAQSYVSSCVRTTCCEEVGASHSLKCKSKLIEGSWKNDNTARIKGRVLQWENAGQIFQFEPVYTEEGSTKTLDKPACRVTLTACEQPQWWRNSHWKQQCKVVEAVPPSCNKDDFVRIYAQPDTACKSAIKLQMSPQTEDEIMMLIG